MSVMRPSRFQQIRERKMESPEFRARYERTRRSIEAVQKILHEIDARREAAGLSKAELARRLGTQPAAVRRVFTSGSSNPTLKTLVEMVDELGLRVRLEPRHVERRDGRPKDARRRIAPGRLPNSIG